MVSKKVLKPLQNRSVEVKSIFLKSRMCGFSLCFCSAHKIYYKTADFCTRGRRGPIQSRKHVVWSPSNLHKNSPNANRDRGHAINLGKRSVWATKAPTIPESKTKEPARKRRTQGQRWRIVCIPNFLKLYMLWIYVYIISWVKFRWCLGGVEVMFRWCLGDVYVIFGCLCDVKVMFR